MNYTVDPEKVLQFQIERNVKLLYKNALIILEDLAEEHDIAMQKLQDALPEEYKKYVDLADYYTEEKGKTLRSKVLGHGNDCIRNLEEILKSFEIKLK